MSKSVVVEPTEQPAAHMAVIDEATRLTEEVVRLADVGGSNLIAIGRTCQRFKNDPDLYKSLSFNTYEAWRDTTFKKKASTAKAAHRIVVNLTTLFTDEAMEAMGTVKCTAYCRLPESEQVKELWKKHVVDDDATTFKARVKIFIGGGDHKEGFVQITFPAPKSFRDETWERVIARGKELNETTDSFVVLEEALAGYEQDLNSSVEGFGEQIGKTFLRIPTDPDERQAIMTALTLAVDKGGQAMGVTLLAALNLFNS